MKVLILCNSSGGLYDFRNDLPLRLIAAGNEVVVSVPDDVRSADLAAEGCRVVHTDIDRRGTNPVRDMGLLKAYRTLLSEERPDIVLTYTIKPNVYGGYLCRRRHIPYIATITGLGSTFQRGDMVKRLVIFLYRLGLKGAGCVFFQNETNRQIFLSEKILCKDARTRLVSGSGVELSHHTLQEYPGHSDDVIRFLYVGRLMREKGTREYLTAARRIHDELGSAVSVAAIGYTDDDLEEELSRAERDGVFKRIPFDREIRPYYREADVVVMPSYHEGMSNVLMEAASAGRPVIASDIPGCRELVEDGVTGLLTAPGDADSLFEAMWKMAGLSVNERREMGIKGRAKMEREFNRKRVIDAYIEVIREMC